MWQQLTSQEDASVNWVRATEDGGYLETRFVQRSPDYFIVYLSSHTGCRLSCRFCHLTATGQTMMTPCSLQDYLEQADEVFAHYARLIAQRVKTERLVHFNFMARGEALSNRWFVEHSQDLFAGLTQRADRFDLQAKFMVSSILPEDFYADLSMVLADPRAMLYYSLYSISPAFRKRWLPRALPVEIALPRIAAYQKRTGQEIKLHWALIAGANDDLNEIDQMLALLNAHRIRASFNLVRYNPKDGRHGVESDPATLELVFAKISAGLSGTESRIVPRVGYDVKASCGMFVA